MTRVTVHAPVKINLYLHITGRREDGYHEVDTLIAFTDFGDEITAEASDTLKISADGPFAAELPEGEDNLVIRAIDALRQSAGEITSAHITLSKHIPLAAGVGGGSADAAAAMWAVSRLWNLDTDKPVDLFAVGRPLGADVPACLYRRPAYASGIGQDLVAAPTLPEAGVLLVNPGVKLATPSVFKARTGGFSPDTSDPTADLQTVPKLVSFLEDRANDLTDAAIKLCPAVEDVLYALERTPGCRLARMSGSGATCFGIFDDRAAAEAALDALEAPDHWWRQATGLAMPTLV